MRDNKTSVAVICEYTGDLLRYFRDFTAAAEIFDGVVMIYELWSIGVTVALLSHSSCCYASGKYGDAKEDYKSLTQAKVKKNRREGEGKKDWRKEGRKEGEGNREGR